MGVWCLPASPKTIWVSPTGSDELNDGISAPLATIQRGIHYASDGDTVELMPGTYTGGRIVTTIDNADGFYGATKRRCNFNNDFMGKKITVDGHGRATIDCEGEMAYFPKRGFIFANGETRETVLRGVKIVGGAVLSATENVSLITTLHVAWRWWWYCSLWGSSLILVPMCRGCGANGAFLHGAVAMFHKCFMD